MRLSASKLAIAGAVENHEFFPDEWLDLQVRMIGRAADIGAIELPIENLVDQLAGCSGPQGQIDRRIGCHIGSKNRRQMQGRRRIERADRQHPGRRSLVGHRAPGVVEQACGAGREGKKPPAGGCQRGPSIGSLEQGEPDFILQRFDPRGDVGLHRVEFKRSLAHAARACHGLEHPKVGSVHLTRSFLRPQRYPSGSR